MKQRLRHKYSDMVSVGNILRAWQNFARGKKQKPDVQYFALYLMDNILSLHTDLTTKTYTHGSYQQFRIADPKPRLIHKAMVRDRVVHHLLHQTLYPFYDRLFIADSHSSRTGKGTHTAMARFQRFFYTASKNNTRTCWVLQCDIKKFFASINHQILKDILKERIPDPDIRWLLDEAIDSFHTKDTPGAGLPLGNLTSQLLVNVYMNAFDQYAKHTLKAKQYVRYADDFVLLSHDKGWLKEQIPRIQTFLHNRLQLTAHKIRIKTVAAGVDYLGWVHFPHHRVLRTTTKRRMFKRIREHPIPETLASYMGMLSHGDAEKLQGEVYKRYIESF